jgi:Zn-dependent alcohol dehydrogenase
MLAAVVPQVNKLWELELSIPKPDINQVLIKIQASGLHGTTLEGYYT